MSLKSTIVSLDKEEVKVKRILEKEEDLKMAKDEMFYYSNRIKDLLKPASQTPFEQNLYDKFVEQQGFWLKRVKNLEEDIACKDFSFCDPYRLTINLVLEDRKVPSSNQFNFDFDASKWGKPTAPSNNTGGWDFSSGGTGWGSNTGWGGGGGGSWGSNWGASNTNNTTPAATGTETSASVATPSVPTEGTAKTNVTEL